MLRGIEEGRAALPAKRPPAPGPHRGGVVGVVLAVAVGGRDRRRPIVGGAHGGRRDDGRHPGARGHGDAAGRARGLLGTDPRLAQDAYAQVLDRDPENAEALTYSGWLLYFASAGASAELRDVAVSTAKQQLARAVAVDAAYPDPHCFLAVIAADADGDTATARAEAEQCLALDPPAQVRELVEGLTE